MGASQHMVQVISYNPASLYSSALILVSRQLPLLLEEQGRRVSNASMGIEPILSQNELESVLPPDCLFLAEISLPNGCKDWIDFLSARQPLRNLVVGDFLSQDGTSQRTIASVNRLVVSSLYVPVLNITISSTENMDEKVLIPSLRGNRPRTLIRLYFVQMLLMVLEASRVQSPTQSNAVLASQERQPRRGASRAGYEDDAARRATREEAEQQECAAVCASLSADADAR